MRQDVGGGHWTTGIGQHETTTGTMRSELGDVGTATRRCRGRRHIARPNTISARKNVSVLRASCERYNHVPIGRVTNPQIRTRASNHSPVPRRVNFHRGGDSLPVRRDFTLVARPNEQAIDLQPIAEKCHGSENDWTMRFNAKHARRRILCAPRHSSKPTMA